MKTRFLAGLSLVVAFVALMVTPKCFGAAVTLESLDPRSISTNGTPPHIVFVKGLSPDGPGLTLTVSNILATNALIIDMVTSNLTAGNITGPTNFLSKFTPNTFGLGPSRIEEPDGETSLFHGTNSARVILEDTGIGVPTLGLGTNDLFLKVGAGITLSNASFSQFALKTPASQLTLNSQSGIQAIGANNFLEFNIGSGTPLGIDGQGNFSPILTTGDAPFLGNAPNYWGALLLGTNNLSGSITTDGANPLWNGAPWPGGTGGDMIWTTNSDLVTESVVPLNTNAVVHILGLTGGYYLGNANSISNNNGFPSSGDVLIAERNGDYGPTGTMVIDVENVMDANFDVFSSLSFRLQTNSFNGSFMAGSGSNKPLMIFHLLPDATPADNVITIQGPDQTIDQTVSLLGNGTISAGRTNQVKFGPQTAPAGTTNITFQVDGQWYQVVATPIAAP